MQNEKVEKTAPKKRILKKANAEIVKMLPGTMIEGTLVSKTSGPWIDKATGEEKDLVRLHFTGDDGRKFIIFEDAGLRNALANAAVKEGDYVQVKKGEKQDLGGGRTVNSYEIFTTEN